MCLFMMVDTNSCTEQSHHRHLQPNPASSPVYMYKHVSRLDKKGRFSMQVARLVRLHAMCCGSGCQPSRHTRQLSLQLEDVAGSGLKAYKECHCSTEATVISSCQGFEASWWLRLAGRRPRTPSVVIRYSAERAGMQGDLYRNAWRCCSCQYRMMRLVAACAQLSPARKLVQPQEQLPRPGSQAGDRAYRITAWDLLAAAAEVQCWLISTGPDICPVTPAGQLMTPACMAVHDGSSHGDHQSV